MSGFNSGILQNASPLSAEAINALERKVLETGEAYAYLDQNSKLCFAMPHSVDCVRELAWNNAYELSSENGTLTKKAYKKTGLKTISLDKVLSKQNINDSWVDPTMPVERLEGDGQEFYTAAPSTLSFRSTAPLNEFQDVRINGQTVDPSNYTLEEGSTIVKLSHEYLKTLDVGSYELSVVSNSKTAKGDFTVTAPELNEHGFYYNQPYSCRNTEIGPSYSSTYIDGALLFREDFTILYVDFENKNVNDSGITWTHNNGIVEFSISGADFTGAFSQDGLSYTASEIFVPADPWGMIGGWGSTEEGLDESGNWHGSGVSFVLDPDVVAADDEYYYFADAHYYDKDYNQLVGMTVLPKDKTKGSYKQIKSDINGRPVVSLATACFRGNTNLKTFTVPAFIQQVGGSAFYECTELTTVNIPNTVTKLGSSAFSGCAKLEAINIPESITRIEPHTFAGCKALTDLMLPEGITAIDDSAFAECSALSAINIPESVKAIGRSAFEYCSSLTSVNIPSSITVLEDATFRCCYKLASVSLPAGLTAIRDMVFYSTTLHNIVLPESLISIGYDVFPSQMSFTVFDSCAYLGTVDNPYFALIKNTNSTHTVAGMHSDTVMLASHAFRNNTKINNIIWSTNLLYTGEKSFEGCTALTEITIPNSIIEISDYTFNNCSNLLAVHIGTGVKSVGWKSFAGCSQLSTMTFAGTVKQWKAANSVDAMNSWYNEVPAEYIQCSDGQVELKR